MSVYNKRRKEQKRVVSEYFVNGQNNMDESLSDFQIPKKSLKASTSKTTVKKQPKKPVKRIKGQKDIRTVLKSKNELVKYSKDFDNICKKSGIDVDSEQLQLAIALSKSLQDADKNCDQSQSSQPLTNQQRTGRIRTTLQEYGFKVPELKICNRRRKKCAKDSKLLLMNIEEKQQKIADKYSQILFENLTINSEVLEGVQKSDLFEIHSKPYSFIKHIENFYVEDLLAIAPNSIGSLLRDWSHIPGRPISPEPRKKHTKKVIDLELTNAEMDLILSGSLEVAQKCVCDKIDNFNDVSQDGSNINKENHGIINQSVDILCSLEEYNNENNKQNRNEDTIEVIHIDCDANSKETSENARKLLTSERCASPDLFDDEISTVLEGSKDTIPNSQDALSGNIKGSQSLKENVTKRKTNDFMDLTECVSGIFHKSLSQSKKKVHSNSTQRKSNDCMEITECTLIKGVINEEIDLTQSSDSNDVTVIVAGNDTLKDDKNNGKNLTQSSNEGDDLPIVFISGNNLLYEDNLEKSPDQNIIETAVEKNLNEELVTKSPTADTHSPCENHEKHKASTSSERSLTFEHYNYNHSDEMNIETNDHPDEINLETNDHSDAMNTELTDVTQNEHDEIDLTQSDSNDLVLPALDIIIEQDDNSIAYDDVEDYNSEAIRDEYITTDEGIANINATNDEDCNNSKLDDSVTQSKSSQSNMNDNSNVFEISDEELNYSVYKSKLNLDCSPNDPISRKKYEEEGIDTANIECDFEVNDDFAPQNDPNFVFGGISILDNTENRKSDQNPCGSTTSNNAVNNDSSILNENLVKDKISTPLKRILNNHYATAKTPTNNEYIIKTQQVTPIVDYAALTTPERNKQLEKYGLKPFKRKRAIQLLTHLYNQTHPVIELSDIPPLNKKLKPTEASPPTAKPNETTRETETDILKGINEKEKGILNEISNRCKEIECADEDWFFQKREKAKISSCRVPLHIAFHNLVNSSNELREAILRYEPINIDLIHKALVGYGHRYDPKDLLKFLDKKCITVKTADNGNARTKKTQRKS